MSEGCTSCGNKGGCDHRKGAMFGAIDQALALLYPTRRFGERIEPLEDEAWAAAPAAAQLARLIGQRQGTLVVELPPAPEAYCHQIEVLCLGRTPSLVEAQHGLAGLAPEDFPDGPIDELYLRVLISDLVPFAAVQQVRLKGEPLGDLLLIEEAPRTGVFDPVLLPRFRGVVAAIAEVGLTHLDFGDISAPPEGFDPGDYAERFGGGAPALANYFFYPQPCSAITTTVVPMTITRGSALGA